MAKIGKQIEIFDDPYTLLQLEIDGTLYTVTLEQKMLARGIDAVHLFDSDFSAKLPNSQGDLELFHRFTTDADVVSAVKRWLKGGL
jgi:hypothetical protein